MAIRLLITQNKKILTATGWVSLLGLVLGVASLVVSMAVISGFESTLRKSVIDVTGHLQIFKLNAEPESWEKVLAKIKKIEPSVQAASRFAIIEGVLAHQGKLSGIFLQGVDKDQIGKVLGLQSRLKEGEFQVGMSGGKALALIGKGIARDFKLKPGDEFNIVVPINSNLDVSQFHRRIGTFKVSGILDLGKYEYDQRWIFTSLSSVQDLAEIGTRYSGLLLKMNDSDFSRDTTIHLSHLLGSGFRVRDWKDINENLFEAVKIEKTIIFFVIFVIVVAAAFNIASSLYINVVRSYPEIAILKALGLSRKKIVHIFSVQGMLMGGIGCLLGILLGLLFCVGFTFLENEFGLIQGSVYKIDQINVQLRWADLLTIVIATLSICFAATWAPAVKASKLTTIEGLRHE